MTTRLDEAMRVVENYLEDFEPDPGLDEAVTTIIASKNAEAMELVSALMSVSPRAAHLPALWALTDDGEADDAARAEALRAITGLLLDAQEDMDYDFDEEPLLDQAEFEAQVERMMQTYRTAENPDTVRRQALEMAANVSQSEEILAAGRAAYQSDDPSWIASGLLVIVLTDVDGRRDAIYDSLDHPDPRVRVEAIHALGLLEEIDDIAMLGKIARRREGAERAVALAALVEIPDPEAGQVLYELTEDVSGAAEHEVEEAYEEWLDAWAGIADYASEEED